MLALCAVIAPGQDPLKPAPIIIHREAQPQGQLTPGGSTNGPARPPVLGDAYTEHAVETTEIETRAAAKDAKDRFDEATPPPLWKRISVALGLIAAALVVIPLVLWRWLKSRRL